MAIFVIGPFLYIITALIHSWINNVIRLTLIVCSIVIDSGDFYKKKNCIKREPRKKYQTKANYYGINVFILFDIFSLQIGQFFKSPFTAQFSHVQICPPGKNTKHISASMQILHKRASSSSWVLTLRFSYFFIIFSMYSIGFFKDFFRDSMDSLWAWFSFSTFSK